MNGQLEYIYGELTYAFGNWKLLPRNRDDIAGFHVITIGIDETQIDNTDWQLFPNPMTDEINILYSGINKNLLIELFDATGRKILEQKSTSGSTILKVQSLSAGTYVIRLTDGTNTIHSKVVKLK